MTLRGFDSSSVQGLIPYWLLSKDMRFGILKSQQGNDGFDPYFERNALAAIAAGVEPFAYVFAYPLPEAGNPTRAPKHQAELFVSRTKLLAGRPLFLDYEWPEPEKWRRWGCSAAQIADWCAENAAEVKRLSGVTPVLYTYPYWWAAVAAGGDVSWAADYPLWIASYPTQVGWPAPGAKPVIPKPWRDWLFWQFDGNGGLRLPNGIDADFCVFNGDAAALQAFIKGAPAPDRPVDSIVAPVIVDEFERP